MPKEDELFSVLYVHFSRKLSPKEQRKLKDAVLKIDNNMPYVEFYTTDELGSELYD